MLDFRQLTLADGELLAKTLQGQEYENSELSFANLYMWRRGWKIEICEQDGVLYFTYRDPDSKCVGHMSPVVPVGRPVRPAVDAALADLKSRKCALDIMGVNESFITRLRQEDTAGLDIEEDRDLEEYVYLREDLVGLQGKKYHAKRNHINRFLAECGNAYGWEPLTPDCLEQCLAISRQWFQGKEDIGNEEVDESELLAVREAVAHMEALGLTGALLTIGGKPCGFTVGEHFRPDMALIHLEKADPSIPGSYAFLNQQFAERSFGDVTYLNREEDMGIPGLRRAKESYYPVKLVKKYRIKEAEA